MICVTLKGQLNLVSHCSPTKKLFNCHQKSLLAPVIMKSLEEYARNIFQSLKKSNQNSQFVTHLLAVEVTLKGLKKK